jgi:hypothetical protein
VAIVGIFPLHHFSKEELMRLVEADQKVPHLLQILSKHIINMAPTTPAPPYTKPDRKAKTIFQLDSPFTTMQWFVA